MAKIAVIQDEKQPVAIEVLATSIRAIAAGVKTLRKGPLGDKALLILIAENCREKNRYGNYVRKVHVAPTTIKVVLDSLETLQESYLRK